MNDATEPLDSDSQGDPRASQELLPLVYDELRRLATQQLAQERPGQTLDATALVHEAYLRLVGPPGPDAQVDSTPGSRPAVGIYWHSRRQFYFAAAHAMRRILIERARARSALKRGGSRQRVDLSGADFAAPDRPQDLLALDAALDRLAAVEPKAAELVQLRYFGGCQMTEAAELLDLSLRSVHRLWAYAKAFLLEELRREA